MARYIDVEPLINWIESEINCFGEPNISIRPVAFGSENALRSVLNKMKELPEADVVEVIRCKHCLKAQETGERWGEQYKYFCKRHHSFVLENDFCNYGEKAGGDMNGRVSFL